MDTNNFTQIMAERIRTALADAGISVPVYAEVESEHVNGNCVRIATQSVDDLIPGNYTADCRGTVECRVSAAGVSGQEAAQMVHRLTECVVAGLRTIHRMEEPNGPGEAPQVVHFVFSVSEASTENPYYIYGISWRAVLQF